MPDKPIIFSAPMIRALLAGTKTQTRRVLTHACDDPPAYVAFGGVVALDEDDTPYQWPRTHSIGDRLWVRETCRAVEHEDGSDAVEFLADSACTRIANTMQAADQWLGLYHYGARGPDRENREGQKVPPIHMPRWASRLTLTVTDVRVQRVQDISEDDAMSEGVCQFVEEQDGTGWGTTTPDDRRRMIANTYGTATVAFRHLWETINGPDAWDQNPWVAAYSFDVHRCNIDRMGA